MLIYPACFGVGSYGEASPTPTQPQARSSHHGGQDYPVRSRNLVLEYMLLRPCPQDPANSVLCHGWYLLKACPVSHRRSLLSCLPLVLSYVIRVHHRSHPHLPENHNDCLLLQLTYSLVRDLLAYLEEPLNPDQLLEHRPAFSVPSCACSVLLRLSFLILMPSQGLACVSEGLKADGVSCYRRLHQITAGLDHQLPGPQQISARFCHPVQQGVFRLPQLLGLDPCCYSIGLAFHPIQLDSDGSSP